MKSAFHISVLILLIGLVTIVPVSKHYCSHMLTQKVMMQQKDHSCCNHEEAPDDCCRTEMTMFTQDNIFDITFSTFEIGDLTDFWTENLLFDFTLTPLVTEHNYSHNSTSEILPKNEVGLYRYVQSFLI